MKKNIRLLITKDYEEMSAKAFEVFKQEILNGSKNFGMATGSTPIGLYKNIIADSKSKNIYADLSYFNLDEYYGLEKEHEQSYYSFMKHQLFDAINASNTHIPDGSLEIENSIVEYQKILDANVIDLQLLGIGNNGHIGFNEPGTPFETHTNFTRLKNTTREANKRFFDNDIDKVPEFALTMGIADIMKSKKVLILANGESKATAIYNMIYGEVTPLVPASILQTHPDLTVVIDYKAASKLPIPTIGIDISSTRVKIATFDIHSNKTAYDVINHQDQDILAIIDEYLPKHLGDMTYKLGVSISGQVNDGIVNSSRLSFKHFDLKSYLEEKYNLDVTVVNRANASAYGEYVSKYSTEDSLYYVTIATGIGGGYVFNGEIVSGKNGLTGEIGNMIVDDNNAKTSIFAEGSLEAVYEAYKNNKDVNFEKYFAKAVSNIIHVIDPSIIVLDIKNPEIDLSIIDKIKEYVKEFSIKGTKQTSIVVSQVEDESLIGAAHFVKQK